MGREAARTSHHHGNCSRRCNQGGSPALEDKLAGTQGLPQVNFESAAPELVLSL